MDGEIISVVWRLHDPLALTGDEIGILKLSEGMVSFTDEKKEVFNVPLIAVTHVNWPFYEIGLCFTAVINEKKYRFIFANPDKSATGNIAGKMIGNVAISSLIAIDGIGDIVDGRDEAKKWKSVFNKK